MCVVRHVLDYQRGQVSTFVRHIELGVRLAREDGEALLIFSGGETRYEAGPRSEAQSYWIAAKHAHWWRDDPAAGSDEGDSVSSRTVTEEYARDSFENLLFSICRFKEVTGNTVELACTSQ